MELELERMSDVREALDKHSRKEHKSSVYTAIDRESEENLKKHLRTKSNEDADSNKIREEGMEYFFDSSLQLRRSLLFDKEIRGSCTYFDGFGANIIHVAYLWKRYIIGRWLVSNYPLEAVKSYSDKIDKKTERKVKEMVPDFTDKDMPYTGENILHLTIVQQNYEETKWLLSFYQKYDKDNPTNESLLNTLLMGNAIGTFFASRQGQFFARPGVLRSHPAAYSNPPSSVHLFKHRQFTF